MFVFIALLALVAVTSIVTLVREVATDGYRALPERRLVRAF